MDKRIGFQVVPDDVNIAEFLEETKSGHEDRLEEILQQLLDTIKETKNNNQPVIFAYGKLLNYLASGAISEPDIHKILAAALWELQ